ncbi:RNA-directed DNA polymerase, eukaryota, reverse transcriptase zinc-binding domain protein [Tanacetum coccineum]|uniref:RNA-directed DNA polymerase, eukaryota, reverse transcriptase zinc-binding domain protein n=1 Tax=Tanacetum coccineum TaxID=301880 RepID=A0ABQ4ZCR9_9ASTR
MSKLDRFLVSESLLSTWPNITVVTLERYLSDHRPILLRESHFDYGPTPFRFFHYWFEMEGFSKIVEDAWRECPRDESNAMINMMGKAEIVNNLQSIDKLHSLETAQKVKVKWSVEGDENSSFFHGMLNKKRNLLNIRVSDRMESGVDNANSDEISESFSSSKQMTEWESEGGPMMKSKSAVLIVGYGIKLRSCMVSLLVSYRRFWYLIESDVVRCRGKHFFHTKIFLMDAIIADCRWYVFINEVALVVQGEKETVFNFLSGVVVQCCLRSSRGSIIINGSPMEEFQFCKGLKQGDLKKASWVNWKKVLAPKERGGLGVSSLYALNRGLMFNMGMGFITADLLSWNGFIKAFHGDDGKMLATTVGFFVFVRAPRGGVEQEQFDEIVALVNDVILAPISDRWTWTLESSGDFSVASVRKLIDDKSIPVVDYKTRWIKYVPIKVNVHAWKVKSDSLLTRFNISRRGIYIDSIMCAICDKGAETSSHLFFSCCMVRQRCLRLSLENLSNTKSALFFSGGRFQLEFRIYDGVGWLGW